MANKGEIQGSDALVKVGVLYVNDLASEKKALEEAQREAVDYERRTRNKTGDAYRRGLEKRIAEVKKHLARVYELEIKYARTTGKESTSIFADVEKEKTKIAKKEALKRSAEETRAQNTYVGKWKKAFATLTRYASSYAIINIVVSAFKKVATEMLNVEANLAKVRAISDATNIEMSKLKGTVWGLSASFGISATEVSKFTIEMAKLGKTPAEIQDVGVEAARLSSILGEDLASSGRLIITTMNQFGLSTQEAGRVSATFFDTIAKSPADIKGL